MHLTNSILHHNCDYTPYEGRELTGYPVMTLSRGEVDSTVVRTRVAHS